MTPYIIHFKCKGAAEIGFLVPIEEYLGVPFSIKRVYYTFGVPANLTRGNHAHIKTEQVLICLTGSIVVKTTDPFGKIEEFVLNKPTEGLFLPPNAWHSMEYSENSVQLVLASELYDENDYIREFNKFIIK